MYSWYYYAKCYSDNKNDWQAIGDALRNSHDFDIGKFVFLLFCFDFLWISKQYSVVPKVSPCNIWPSKPASSMLLRHSCAKDL